MRSQLAVLLHADAVDSTQLVRRDKALGDHPVKGFEQTRVRLSPRSLATNFIPAHVDRVTWTDAPLDRYTA